MKRKEIYKTFWNDPSFDREKKLPDGWQYTPHLHGVLSYVEESLFSMNRQLEALSTLFIALEGSDSMVEPSKLGGIGETLAVLSFEAAKCHSALVEEATELTEATKTMYAAERIVRERLNQQNVETRKGVGS